MSRPTPPFALFALILAVGCGGNRAGAAASPAQTALPSLPPPAPAPPVGAPRLHAVRWPGALTNEWIDLRGEGFPTAPGAVTVHFSGGASEVVTADGPGQVRLRVPPGAVSGPVVVEARGQRSNPFPLTVWGNTIAPDDHGSTMASATPLALGQLTPGRVDAAFDEDWFSIPLVGGAPYAVRTLGLTDAMHTLVNLVDRTGTSLAISHSGAGYGAAIDVTPPASGTYYLQVTHWRRNPDRGGYQVWVADAATPVPPSPTNTAPTVEAPATPQGTQSGPVTFSFTLVDPDADPLAVLVGYREWSATATPFRPATVHVTSNPTTGVASSAAGRTWSFTWDSAADVGAVSGSFQLEVQAADGAIVGPLRSTGAFLLDNTGASSPAGTAPSILSVGTPLGTQQGAVTIPYVVADDASDPVRIDGEFMLSAASGWRPATVHLTSDPVTGVATSPTGRSYRFVWDSAADLPSGTHAGLVFRVTADDGLRGVPRVTGAFTVSN